MLACIRSGSEIHTILLRIINKHFGVPDKGAKAVNERVKIYVVGLFANTSDPFLVDFLFICPFQSGLETAFLPTGADVQQDESTKRAGNSIDM